MFKLSKTRKLNLLTVYKKTKHLYDDVPYIKRKRRKIYLFKFLKYFSYVIAVLFVISLLFLFLYFRDLNIFYNTALSGKKNIEEAADLILSGKYAESSNMAILAQDDFFQARQIIEKYQNYAGLKHIVYLQIQMRDLKYLVSSAEIISKAIKQTSEFAKTLENILVKKNNNFNQLSIEDKKKLLGIIYKSSPELTGIKANIDLAIINLNNISFSGVLLPFKQKIFELEKKLHKAENGLSTIIPLSNFVPAVLGYPEKSNYLFLLQNSDELRPTGGFIGTYGILQTEYGDILRLNTHDIYHLDMPVKDFFSKEPPEPLKKYLGVDKWYMRDANWSPDWPTSARQIEWFYYAEDDLLPKKNQINNLSDDFDGVITITPKVITDLLSLVGPVVIEGQEFNKDNFVDLLQYRVEQEYMQLGISSWHRKEIIGEIVKELKIKLFDLQVADLYKALDILNINLLEKNILLYFNDNGYQEIAEEKGWTGEIKHPSSDYLMVVDANMASYKTDAVMAKAIHYRINQNSANEIIADLVLNYAHHGDFDWKTTRYRTYTRVYVPRGSQLISTDGMENEKIEVYEEFGKTVFAFFAVVEPGEIKNIKFSYKLPKWIEGCILNNNYALFVQKQPGNNIQQLTLDMNFSKDIDVYHPTGFFSNKINDKGIEWDTDLKTDRSFVIKLK